MTDPELLKSQDKFTRDALSKLRPDEIIDFIHPLEIIGVFHPVKCDDNSNANRTATAEPVVPDPDQVEWMTPSQAAKYNYEKRIIHGNSQ